MLTRMAPLKKKKKSKQRNTTTKGVSAKLPDLRAHNTVSVRGGGGGGGKGGGDRDIFNTTTRQQICK